VQFVHRLGGQEGAAAADGVAQAQTGAYQLVDSIEEPLGDVNDPHQGRRSVTSRP
jgi:hypothetical protein